MYQVSTISIVLYFMLSKAQNKYIRSLTQQKYRKEHKVFVAEGEKIAAEWLQATGSIQMIVATADWADQHKPLIDRHKEASLYIVGESELAALSTLQTPNKVMLVVHAATALLPLPYNEWAIVLDDIRDPGNMGTIIRTADWFGIRHVVCSPACVDAYNPKVIQSAMGGHLRVAVHEAVLEEYLPACKMPILVAALDGDNVYSQQRQPAAALVIGNESKGVSPAIAALATHKVMIPRIGGAESLNAGVSAGILCALLVPC
jgi:RNA methyltransferase, TrmH family